MHLLRRGLGLLLLGACAAEEVYVPQPLDTGWVADGGAGDGGGGGACSDPAASTPATMHVHNGTPGPVRVLWVDVACVEQDYGTLQPDQAYDQPTYVGHVWRFVGGDSGALLAEVDVDETSETVELTE